MKDVLLIILGLSLVLGCQIAFKERQSRILSREMGISMAAARALAYR